MKEKKVWLLTEGGIGIGFGHIMRTSAIYAELVRRGIWVKFLVYGLEVNSFLKNYYYENVDWRNEEYLATIISKEDYVIVDSYLAEEKLCHYISSIASKALFIDDTKRIDYPAGVVLNPSPIGKELDYPKLAGVKYLLGAEFVILREPFQENFNKILQKQITTVLLTLGGVDVTNTMPLLIKLLNEQYPQIKKYVVMGSSSTNQGKSLLGDRDELYGNITAEQMRELMLKVDFAISACGQTLLEVAKVGLPTIAIQTADNQKYNVEFWTTNQSILYAGNHSDPDLVDNIKTHLLTIQDSNVRVDLVAKGLNIAKQFAGVQAIVNEFLKP